jgi:soluble lytic murein transglycosylase
LFQTGKDAQALATLSQASVQEGLLGHYALYYVARSYQRMGKTADALRTFRLLRQRQLVGYLREASALGEAETLEATGEHAAAAIVYEGVTKEQPLALDQVLLSLGRTAEAAGQKEPAVEAYLRVYYEFPLSEHALAARARLDTFSSFGRIMPGTERYRLELGRAQRLYAAKQYPAAKSAYEALSVAATPDDKDLVDLRLAALDFYLRRHRAARDGAARLTKKGTRQAEALYFEAVASRALGDSATYVRNVRSIVDKHPESPWAQEALNHLATQYIRQDDDGAADTVFREMIQRYPRGPFTERAVWKVGWRSFREGRHAETAQLFDRAAVDFPRSDYRPAWLFWSGRAHQANQRPDLADARFTLASLDYLNSYYGRLAVERLNGRVPPPRVIREVPGPAVPPPPNTEIVRALLEVELYDDALNELKFIQRVWGDSAAVQATIAWIYRQQGLTATGREQFTLLRGSISTMRRAYPQFMAAGGEYLPKDVLSHIFPIAYWDLIQKYSAAGGLDPYLVAALMAQESTFVPDVRSSANAVGLMQLIPPTARIYARKVGLPYSAKLMTDPEANIRMGTTYLTDLMRQFGRTHLALASYNAGEGAVRRWLAERPGVPTDEFIDDIPYPETQNYVKRILGTSDDYRRLYGGVAMPPLQLTQAGDASSLATPVFASDAAASRLVDERAVAAVTATTPVKPAVKKGSRPRAGTAAKPAQKARVKSTASARATLTTKPRPVVRRRTPRA